MNNVSKVTPPESQNGNPAQESSGDRPATFGEVLKKELSAIQAGRALRRREKTGKPTESPAAKQGQDSLKRADEMGLVGLAFSGGGIRSATFNLGVLQGLARLKLLDRFDYLSTVSGGGYIGSWLAAWIHRGGSLKTVEEKLNPHEPEQPCKKEAPEIRFLRDYSNYLTPRLGLFSADTWTLVAIYLRNLLLNLLILAAALGTVLLFPRIVVELVQLNLDRQQVSASVLLTAWEISGLGWTLQAWPLLLFTVLLLSLAVSRIFANLRKIGLKQEKDGSTQRAVQIGVVIPLLLSAWLGSLWLWLQTQPSGPRTRWPYWVGATVIYLALWVIALWRASRGVDSWRPRSKKGVGWAILVGSTLISGVVGGLLLTSLADALHAADGWVSADGAVGHVVVLGPLLMVLLFKLVVVVHIGLMGVEFPTQMREWWGRLGGWMFIYSLGWLAVFGISLYAPLLREVKWGPLAATISGGLSFLYGLGGALAGHSAATGKRESPHWIEWAIKGAPLVFVLGSLLLLSLGLDMLLGLGGATAATRFWFEVHLLLFLITVAVLLAWRVDINEFSMHLLYRNRLTRCYLGASRGQERSPNPFTGFDPNDDVLLSKLSPSEKGEEPEGYTGPYPIVNGTLNLTGGKHLAWQQRKGASFVFTPEYCGYEFPVKHSKKPTEGYRPTSSYAYPEGPYLGTAVAVSGAAASPNMGYHSSAALAFLMTVFNVRLGWWVGNPGKRDNAWRKSGPLFGLRYLLKELFGTVDEESSFLYLSDGGHFENLAIYELVRRHCTLIVACDSESDPKMEFGGLGNAIEKCRTDFGVDIEVDTEQLERDTETGYSKWHCVVGKIRYDRVCQGAPVGTLIYLKSSLTGDEPTDIQSYGARHTEFPHQTTADQWFGESQFESYRKLGFHVVESAFGPLDDDRQPVGEMSTERLTVRFRHRWFPPSRSAVESFTQHTKTVDEIFRSLREDEDLKFMDVQLYPPWEGVMGLATAPSPPAPQFWLPAEYEQRRAGFYLCNRMIQLMENVYFDLDLEEEYRHPDNRGWMNWFRHWSWSGMFRVTWAMSSSAYGARFQTFCERHLDLPVGVVSVEQLLELQKPGQPVLGNWEQEAQAKLGVNFWEVKLLQDFFRQKGNDILAGDQIHALQMVVKDPRDQQQEVRINFGFALLQATGGWRQGVLRHLRVQDHLRRMGLGRRALAALVNKFDAMELEWELPGMGPREIPGERDCRQVGWMFTELQRERERGR